MATSEQTPSPALLGLRPADVVRLCGLNAAAAGLDLSASHNVAACRRDGQRLMATVIAEAPHTVWVMVGVEGESVKWLCDCGQVGPLACAHVAATLSAWITHPGDFIADGPEAPALPVYVVEQSARDDSMSGHHEQSPVLPRRTSGPSTVSSLEAAIARMHAADVEAIARRILGAESTGDVTVARRRVVAALSDSEHVQAIMARLDQSTRMLLTLVDLAGGTVTAADLEALAIRIERPVSAVLSDVEVLERHALLLPMLPATSPRQHGPGSSWRHVAGWRIPDESRRAWVLPLPLEALPVKSGNQAAPPTISGVPLRTQRTTPRNLCLALALIAGAPSPLGLPHVATDAKPGSNIPASSGGGILAPGELASGPLRDLSRGAGLDPGTVRLARRVLLQARERQPSQPIADFGRVPVAERPVVLRAAFRRWLRAETAADLLDIEAVDGIVRVRYATAHQAFRPAAIAREVADARRFVARLLSHARTDRWYSMESLIELAWQARPGFLRGQQQVWATPAWWLESMPEKRALQPQARGDWITGEGAYIRSVVADACAVWGGVDLAVSRDGAVMAFRLNAFGAFLFSRENARPNQGIVALCDGDWGPVVLPVREGALAVQPLAAQPVLLDALALWARPIAVSGRRLVYALSPDHACAAFDQRLSPHALPAILRPRHARAADVVERQLAEWHSRWGGTRITAGYTLIEASDEATLVEALAAAPEVAARCQRIGPAMALALPGDAESLRTLLARRGYAV